MIRISAYKVKGKSIITADKEFAKAKLSAKEEDFEAEEYTLIIPVSKIDEWAEKLKNTRQALKGGAKR